MKKEILNQFIARAKTDKKFLGIVLAGAMGVILIVLSLGLEKDDKSSTAITEPTVEFNETEYISQLETKLSEMISLINGAGRAKVVVTLECDYETVYAKDGRVSIDDDSTDEDSQYIIIDSKETQNGLLLKTVTPKVRGVAVVCEGGDDMSVRTAVTEMLSAVLDVGVNRISVAKIK